MKKKNLKVFAIMLFAGLVAPAIIFIFQPNNDSNKFSGKRVVEYLSDDEKKMLDNETKIFLQDKKTLIVENNSKTNFQQINIVNINDKVLQQKKTNKGTFIHKFDIETLENGKYQVHFINFNATLKKQFIIK